MKKGKKLLGLLLAVALLVVCGPLGGLSPVTATALAEDGFLYTVQDETATIVGYSGSESELTLPGTLGGYPVTAIGELAFEYNEALTLVVIPDGITEIGYNAFQYCSNLVSATLPATLTTVPPALFYGCGSLQTVDIPEGITTIEYEAFCCCTSLESITLPNSATAIQAYAFMGCSALKDIDISRITSIGSYAFGSCENLSAVTLSAGLTEIDYFAFQKCTSLTNVVIPEGVTEIGNWAFGYCSALTTVTIPATVTFIGYAAFYGCDALLDLYYTGTEESWNAISAEEENEPLFDAIIHYPCIHEYDKSNVCTHCGYIDTSRFTYTISNGQATITRYVDDVFSGELTIPSTLEGYPVTTLADYAMSGLSVSGLVVPDSIKKIGLWEFFGCFNLQYIHFPSTIRAIESRSFYGCKVLTDVYYHGTKEQWDSLIIYSDNEPFYFYATKHFNVCTHVWTEATCTTPKTCSVCGETTGEALGHLWRGVASCTQADTCRRCGLTNGEPAGHSWVAATCTLPAYCSVCSELGEDALGHGWKSATCTSPVTCVFCGETIGRALGHSYDSTFTCTVCGHNGSLLPDDYYDPTYRPGGSGVISPGPGTVTGSIGSLTIDSAVGQAGDTVTLVFSFERAAVKSLALSAFTYDSDKLELLNGEWAELDSVIAVWDAEKANAVITFSENRSLSGKVFALTFRIKDGATFDTLPISCAITATTMTSGIESSVVVSVNDGYIEYGIAGDMNGDAILDNNDAVYLLFHTMLPEQYALSINGDMDKNGLVDSNDAIYLLYHALLPDQYPLY